MTAPTRKFFLIIGGAALVFSLGVVSTVAYVKHQGYITVRVQEKSPHGDDISIRFPAAFVQAGLPFVPRHELSKNAEFCKHREVFRTVMTQLADVPDCDLVTVDSPDENVRIRKSGGELVIDVQDHGDKVFVSVPVKVLHKVAKWM